MGTEKDETPSQKLADPDHPSIFWRIAQRLFQIMFVGWTQLRIKGREQIPRTGGGLVISNHQSYLDPVVLQVALPRPISFLARDTLFRVPFLKLLFWFAHVFPLKREATSTATIRGALGRMKHGYLVGMFPEGTRSRDGSLGEFKPGFIALVRRAKLPIYPVGIAGSGRASPRGKFAFLRKQITMVYGKPLIYDELEPFCKKGREKEFVQFIKDRVGDCQQQAEDWCRKLTPN